MVLTLAFILAVVHRPEILRGQANMLAFFVALFAVGIAPDEISEIRFYELAIQVVPILFLALGVEMRSLRISRDTAGADRRMATFTALFLVVAGFESFRAIASGDAESVSFNVVAAALAGATTALVIPVLVGLPESIKDSEPHEQQAKDVPA